MNSPELRQSWFLPSWKNLPDLRNNKWIEVPTKHPRMKIDFTGVVNCSTYHDWPKTPRVIFRVVYDMMRRLREELGCDCAPIDYSIGGEAWVQILNGEPIGCVTVCADMGEPMLLGAWVKPTHRRTGVMTNLWSHVVSKYGQIKVVRPSSSMKAWMASLAVNTDE